MDLEFAPHVEEIKKALDTEIENSTITADLKKLLEFRVPVEEAKRSLIKKYGGGDKSILKKLKDIAIGDINIELTAQVVEITKKTINVKNSEKTIFSGLLSDETASRNFTSWNDPGMNVGDVVNISQAYVRNWQDRPEVNISNRSKITKLNQKINIVPTIVHKKISDIKEGDVNVETAFTILKIEPHDINMKDGIKKILNGIAADDNSKVPFTSWVLIPEIAPGNTIEVKNAYVRSFRGVPTLHINENSTVTRLERTIQYNELQKVLIGDLIEKEGAFDTVIEGNILSIRPGSGLIARCPECSRVIQKSICRVHGKVEEKSDMRIKAIIDDGTGALTLVLNSELTQSISGITVERSKEITRTAMSHKAVEDEIKKKLLGKVLAARGNMSKGEYGVTLVATKVWESPNRMQERVIELLKRADNGKNT